MHHQMTRPDSRVIFYLAFAMWRTKGLLLSSLFLVSMSSVAQNNSTSVSSKSYQELPTIDINFGINHLFGDVAIENGLSPYTQFGYQLKLSQCFAQAFQGSFTLHTGAFHADETRGTTGINYRTSFVSQQLSLEYNFFPLLKPKENGRQLIRPYVGAGVGMIAFRSKGDLKDANGNTYHYWSDGTVRNVPDGSVPPSESTILERDRIYETDLRSADVDGLGNYPQVAFSVPINAGLRFQFSDHLGMNVAFSYVFNFNDLIDNVSSASTGAREGNDRQDNHLFGSIGLSFYIGRSKKNEVARETPPTYVKEDKDGDLKESEPVSQTVEDTTELKQPDSTRIEEPLMEHVRASDPEPAPEQEEVEKNVSTSTDTDQPSAQKWNLETIEQMPDKNVGDYHWADLNRNGRISPDEVLHFIDLLFEGTSERTVTDIQNLIDQYFDQ